MEKHEDHVDEEPEALTEFRGPVSGTKEAPIVKPPPDLPKRYPDPVVEIPQGNGEHPGLDDDEDREGFLQRLRDALIVLRG